MAATSPDRLEQHQVAVVIEPMSADDTKTIFGADLVGHRIQPLMLVLHNGSDQPYQFNKTNFGASYLPAAQVAQQAKVHPIITAVHWLKWMVFVIPGFVMEAVVEPASTLDFPNFEEAAHHPPAANPQGAEAAFRDAEIADQEIPPDTTCVGLLFVRQPAQGATIPITLVNAKTHQPLLFNVTPPPPSYRVTHRYPHSYDVVWNAAIEAVSHVPGWQTRSIDHDAGVVTIRSTRHYLFWKTTSQLILTIQPVEHHQTQLTFRFLLRPGQRTGTTGQVTMERFFSELNRLLPASTLPPLQAPS